MKLKRWQRVFLINFLYVFYNFLIVAIYSIVVKSNSSGLIIISQIFLSFLLISGFFIYLYLMLKELLGAIKDKIKKGKNEKTN